MLRALVGDTRGRTKLGCNMSCNTFHGHIGAVHQGGNTWYGAGWARDGWIGAPQLTRPATPCSRRLKAAQCSVLRLSGNGMWCN